jgi:superfamily II DNA or RNA helicase
MESSRALLELFDAVRERCGPANWSRGVELARAGSVLGERDAGDEVVLRVATRGGLISRSVTLFVADTDWECDCPARDGACEHAAAAVIALRRAREAGESLPGQSGGTGTIGYRLERRDGALALERAVVVGAAERALLGTLAALASGRADGPAFAASQRDLAVEQALGSNLRGVLPRERVARVLAALAGSDAVRLGGVAVRTSATAVLPVARVEDRGDGFAITLEADPSVTETFENGAALCGDLLRPIGDAKLSLREQTELARGWYFSPERTAELVADVLPSLRERLPVDVRTRRLPDTTSAPPRPALDVRREGDRLSVLATIVYGDGPNARVDGARLVWLGGPLPLRDEAAERRIAGELAQKLELVPGHRVELSGAAAVALAERIARFSGEVRGRAHEHFRLAPPLVARVRVAGDDFEAWFESESPDGGGVRARRADPAAVLRAWSEGESLVPLAGGGFAPLPADWLARHGQRLADLLAARDAGGALARAALPDLARLCDDLDLPRPPSFARLAALVEGFEGIPAAELPADLGAALRAYQRRGVDWLGFLASAGLGGVLADDMGLGKTCMSLCALRGRTLVVCPTSVLQNWQDEIAKFRPALRASLYHGPRRALDPMADVTVTSYAILRLDADALAALSFGTVILDEAQAIKNPDSQLAQAAYRLRGDFKLALSGTPVENRLEELWSLFHFANRGLLGGRADFDARYARPIRDGVPGAGARLRERIRPFLLRRRKREVAPELPPRTEITLRCELPDSERAVYDAIRAATRAEVVERLRAGGSVLAALEALLRLRQAACHPGLVPGQHAETSSKLEMLLESLENVVEDGHKALVFSQWTQLLDRVEPLLRRAEFPFARLDGSTRDRAGVVARFQDESGPPILLVSLRAGGTGLNLTAADHVFLLDPWWNPAVEDQAADRTHRIGQERPVFVYRLVARETVEEGILALQARKRELAASALEGAEAGAALTREDLLGLLE